MQKQQIKDAFNQGYRDGEEDAQNTDISTMDISKFGNAQTYFEETFEQ
jgi:tRNA threonylcarbamoyladenosine modification (KEOPS) complex Cgi121 subunit